MDYLIVQMSVPPMFFFWASRPVKTPYEVSRSKIDDPDDCEIIDNAFDLMRIGLRKR